MKKAYDVPEVMCTKNASAYPSIKKKGNKEEESQWLILVKKLISEKGMECVMWKQFNAKIHILNNAVNSMLP